MGGFDMVSRDVKRKLAALNRKRLDKRPPATSGGASPASANTQTPPASDMRTIFVPEMPEGVADRSCPRIEEIAPGREMKGRSGGIYWLIERHLTQLDSECVPFLRRFAGLVNSEAVILPEKTSATLGAFVECDPRKVLYLDLETTGLSAQPLFLVGAMEFTGDDFLLKQFFARNYAEEQHLLSDLVDYFARFDLLVTFNGKSFDVPYVRNRAVVNRFELTPPPVHLDLLHESRRRWAKLLPNCKLVTLEEFICRRRRVDDIPGSEIPAAYHEFVHTANAEKMRHVIHHNALDLVTMAEIALYMLTGKNDWS